MAIHKKQTALLLLVAVETCFLVLSLSAVVRPLEPYRLLGACHVNHSSSGIGRHVTLETTEGWPRQVTDCASRQLARFEPVVALVDIGPEPEPRTRDAHLTPLLTLLARLKLPTSRSDEPPLLGC